MNRPAFVILTLAIFLFLQFGLTVASQPNEERLDALSGGGVTVEPETMEKDIYLPFGSTPAEAKRLSERLKKGKAAIAEHDRILAKMPNNVEALKGKGNNLRILSGLMNGMDQRLAMLEEAVQCFDRAIKIAPKDDSIYAFKGKALECLAELHVIGPQEGPNPESKPYALRAIRAFEKAISLNPGRKISCGKELRDAQELAHGRLPEHILQTMDKIGIELMKDDPSMVPDKVKKELLEKYPDLKNGESKP